MLLARWSFGIAATWGVFILLPLYFQEDWLAIAYPPAMTHPEYFFSFITIGLSMQFVFLLIAIDPLRLRPVMLACIAIKIGFPTVYLLLFHGGRIGFDSLQYALPDFVFAALFIASYLRLKAADARYSSVTKEFG